MDELQTVLAELQNPDSNVRELALDKIGTLNPNNAFEIIAPFLTDPDPEIRGAAACNLGEIDDSRSVPLLINSVRKDSVEEVRAEALASLENYRMLEILICLIDEVHREKKSRRPRQIAAKQLQYYNTEQSLAALSVLLLQDEDVYVRIFAADSLLKLNHPKLQEVWRQALEDESSYVFEIANKALANLQDFDELLQTG